MTEQELLADCLKRLNQSGLPYMLVGSMASNYWGVPRSTHDIDFVIQFDSKDVQRLIKSFEDEFFIQAISVESALRPPHQFSALDNRSALKVDFFRVPDEPYEKERFRRRQAVTLFDQPAFIARPEDIVLHKLRWHTMTPSDRQLKDAAGILRVSSDAVDQSYLTHWANTIGVTDLLEQVKNLFPPA